MQNVGFAEFIVDSRASQLLYWDPSFLSEESLRKVIDTAFQVSLMPEEGRYPRFSIFLPMKERAGKRVVDLAPVDLIAKNRSSLGSGNSSTPVRRGSP